MNLLIRYVNTPTRHAAARAVSRHRSPDRRPSLYWVIFVIAARVVFRVRRGHAGSLRRHVCTRAHMQGSSVKIQESLLNILNQELSIQRVSLTLSGQRESLLPSAQRAKGVTLRFPDSGYAVSAGKQPLAPPAWHWLRRCRRAAHECHKRPSPVLRARVALLLLLFLCCILCDRADRASSRRRF